MPIFRDFGAAPSAGAEAAGAAPSAAAVAAWAEPLAGVGAVSRGEVPLQAMARSHCSKLAAPGLK